MSASSPDLERIIRRLRETGLLAGADVQATPLKGGVSSDIFLVSDGARRVVVKQALARLRVKDAWFADVSRNRSEQAFFRYAANIIPDAVPRILHADEDQAWFAMEFLDADWVNWKAALLAGRVELSWAGRAGDCLGRLHAASWDDAVARQQFATLENFDQLRIDPYLRTTARRLSAARAFLEAEADAMSASATALVHGDYSPKNLMFRGDGMKILDAEVAWFGDPAFDVAFLLTHLHLKMLVRPEVAAAGRDLVARFWGAYADRLGPNATAGFEARIVRLLICILLARVHGKSPAEYLVAERLRDWVTRFCVERVVEAPAAISEFTEHWRTQLPEK